jgi:hypothetical protein
MGLIALLVVWSVSLSIGYNSPMLGSGILLLMLYSYIQRYPNQDKPAFSISTLSAIAVLFFISFLLTRSDNIYGEREAAQLSYPLDGLLPGGQGVYTNVNQYNMFSDLKTAINFTREKGTTFAILPDFPGFWAVAPTQNPLPIDWIHPTELNHRLLQKRVVDELELKRANNICIVQKFETATIAYGFVPLKKNSIVQYVKAHFNKIHETSYFDLYQ